MKVYLSGPMSGIAGFNAPLFKCAAVELRAQGYEVISPLEEDLAAGIDATQFSGDIVEFERQTKHTWGDLLSRDVKLLADGEVDGIVTLPKWYESKGARLEVFLGLLKGMTIYAYDLGSEPRPYNTHTVLWFIEQSFQ